MEVTDLLQELKSKNGIPAIRNFELLEDSPGKLSEIKRENSTLEEANDCSWLRVACCGLKSQKEGTRSKDRAEAANCWTGA